MPLSTEKVYFLGTGDAVLRIAPKDSTKKNATNHLLLGDELVYLGEEQTEWAKFKSRRTEGWLKKEWVTDQRLLEVNFVDIGQGDGCHVVTPNGEVLVIDAGEGVGFDGKAGDNMLRFMNWRYNLRDVSADDEQHKVQIDYAIITHPDLDHYYGFYSLFKHPQIKVKTIGHNGIVERSIKDGSSSTWMYDFGRKIPPMPYKRRYHLWDTVLTHDEMIELLESQSKSGKYYLKTLIAGYENNPDVKFSFLSQKLSYLDHFKGNNPVHLNILGPLTEPIKHEGETRECLLKLGGESITKNGHSVIFQLKYGKVRMILGGDLNSKSQDYLGQFYSGNSKKMSDLEEEIDALNNQLEKVDISEEDVKSAEEKLNAKNTELNAIVRALKKVFGTDVAKACHHGSSDVLDSFLAAINPLATVISSGDGESHSHPRPDVLGAYGKSGRGKRPLIFSTELARSTNEFSYPFKFYSLLKKLEERMNAMTSESGKAIYRKRMESLRDSNVAKYGLITVRTNGDEIIIAQKLEKAKGPEKKWDLYRLTWNNETRAFEIAG